MKAQAEAFNIKYEIIGREDGRWVVRAFDRNNKAIGNQVIVQTPSEAWKIYMLLNGYAYIEPTELTEDTQPTIEIGVA